MQKALLVVLLFLFVHLSFPSLRPSSEGTEVLGRTTWSCYRPEPDANVTAELVLRNPAQAQEVAVHELMHKAQFLRYGSCLRWTVALFSGGWEFAFNLEAEAFCAEAKEIRKRNGLSNIEVAVSIISPDLMLYGFPVTRTEAHNKILSYCTKDL